MNYQIIPGILRQDEISFLKDFEAAKTFAKRIQIDIIDGTFAPTKTVDATFLKNVSFQFPVEIDLMVVDPDEQINHFILPWVDLIVIHVETVTGEIQRLIDLVHEQSIHCALAFSPGSSFDILYSLHSFDQITFMTVVPGMQGHPFQDSVLANIELVRKAFPDVDIEVDGGITDQTLPKCKKAGANIFVSGSYLFWHDNPKEQYAKLQESLEVAQRIHLQ